MRVIICVHSCMYIFSYSHARFNMCAFIDVHCLQVKRFACRCYVLKSDKFIPYLVEKRPHVPLYDQHACTTINTRLSRWLVGLRLLSGSGFGLSLRFGLGLATVRALLAGGASAMYKNSLYFFKNTNGREAKPGG